MDENKTQDLLIQLLQKVAIIEAKLDANSSSLNEIKSDAKSMAMRVDKLEAQNERHEKCIKSLEHRADVMEQWTRTNLSDAKKQQTSVFISLGLAVFSCLISFIMNLF